MTTREFEAELGVFAIDKMSVTVTKTNGLVVVTQVFQSGEEIKMPMTPITQTKSETVEPSNPVPPMTKVFLKGQPKPLGVVQICTGLMTMLVGVIFMVDQRYLWGAPLWSGTLFVLSGIFSVIAHKGTDKSKIKGTQALNIVCVLLAVAGVVIYCLYFISGRLTSSGCERESRDYNSYGDNEYYWDCTVLFWKYQSASDGMMGILLVLAVLEFSVALTGAIFAGKAIEAANQPTVVVIEKPMANTGDADSLYGSDVGLLDADDGPSNPPPYDD
ncbi:hypothetical protein AGOR_G00034400 [Albula goreensis]|uniref:Uncharacterized protein n=1 Tax=Albula goreensis TaxID=1534307 RepID=A0A8T3E0A6_9TELE|nr:hypothetical protein AGOR_G00034400 [Albula goreensis]